MSTLDGRRRGGGAAGRIRRCLHGRIDNLVDNWTEVRGSLGVDMFNLATIAGDEMIDIPYTYKGG